MTVGKKNPDLGTELGSTLSAWWPLLFLWHVYLESVRIYLFIYVFIYLMALSVARAL